MVEVLSRSIMGLVGAVRSRGAVDELYGFRVSF